MMPRWLQIVAQVNPLTYAVDALRGAYDRRWSKHLRGWFGLDCALRDHDRSDLNWSQTLSKSSHLKQTGFLSAS